jgi:hypothetical protein
MCLVMFGDRRRGCHHEIICKAKSTTARLPLLVRPQKPLEIRRSTCHLSFTVAACVAMYRPLDCLFHIHQSLHIQRIRPIQTACTFTFWTLVICFDELEKLSEVLYILHSIWKQCSVVEIQSFYLFIFFWVGLGLRVLSVRCLFWGLICPSHVWDWYFIIYLY